jgi:hypothetical protein
MDRRPIREPTLTLRPTRLDRPAVTVESQFGEMITLS